MENLIAASKHEPQMRHKLQGTKNTRHHKRVNGDANCSQTELIYNFGNAPPLSPLSPLLQSDTIIAHTHDRAANETHLWFSILPHLWGEKLASRLFFVPRVWEGAFWNVYCQICALSARGRGRQVHMREWKNLEQGTICVDGKRGIRRDATSKLL